mgnify:FL=1
MTVQPEVGSIRPRALVVEDEVATRTLLAHALDGMGFDATQTQDRARALELAARDQPDIIVLDLNLGQGPTGIDLIDPLLEAAPYCAILILTTFRSPQLAGATSQLPAAVSFLCKRDLTSIEILTTAVEAAMEQERLPSTHPAQTIVISQSQSEVSRMMADGMSNAAIRVQRGCSIRAVERVVSRLFTSLGIESDDLSNMRARAIRMYLEADIVVK